MYTAAGHPNTSPCPTLTPMQPRSPSSSSFCRMRAGSATCRSPSLKSRRFERRGRVWLQLSLRRPLTASCQSAILRWHPLREDRMEFDRRRREFITLLGGGAVAWPLAVRAQQPAMPVIGFMSARSPEDSAHLLEAFRRGLKEGGFAENENVAIEFRWAKGDYGRLPALVADLVSRQVVVIVAAGGEPSVLAAKAATVTIPIVFGIGGDPVRLGLLRDLAPGVSLIGTLINPKFPAAVHQLQQLEEAARSTGQRIVIAEANSDE